MGCIVFRSSKIRTDASICSSRTHLKLSVTSAAASNDLGKACLSMLSPNGGGPVLCDMTER